MKKTLIFMLMISLLSLISIHGIGEENIENIESLPRIDSSKYTEAKNEKTEDEKPGNTNISEKSENDKTLNNNIANSESGDSMVENSRVSIKMSFNNEEIVVKMHDNPTSRDFLTLLPLTLTFEDYAATEKISYLPRNLSTDDAPKGFDPSEGDLTLYAPWGNLAIFYKDYGYARGLIPLGKIETGVEKLAGIREDFTVVIEKVE